MFVAVVRKLFMRREQVLLYQRHFVFCFPTWHSSLEAVSVLESENPTRETYSSNFLSHLSDNNIKALVFFSVESTRLNLTFVLQVFTIGE